MLKIHNSLTGEKEEFKPLRANEVRMYVCGMTVYDYIHIGHARMLTVFDLVQRYLRSRGYQVTYVRSITDIDDKIIQRAAQMGEDWREFAQRFAVSMQEDCVTLGLQTPDREPRATDFIPAIIAMTQTLIDKGYAYVAGNGDVMYAVRKFPNYGRLSGKRIDDLRAGSRVQVDESTGAEGRASSAHVRASAARRCLPCLPRATPRGPCSACLFLSSRRGSFRERLLP